MLLLDAPLHSLRKTRFFKALLRSRFNRPKMFELGFSFPIALRPLTHASIRWTSKRVEPKIRQLVTDLILALDQEEDKGSFFDVGANVGLYSLLVCSLSSNRKIIAFEPDPLNLELLGMTQAQVRSGKWEVNAVALSDESGHSHFSQDEITSATGTLFSDEKPWIEKYLDCKAQTIRVRTNTLDQFTDSSQWPSLIKIDVEGHECRVLNGAMHTLERNKPLIILESFPPQKIQVIEKLDRLGYEFADADCWQALEEGTTNLFAWHPEGPLPKIIIKRILNP